MTILYTTLGQPRNCYLNLNTFDVECDSYSYLISAMLTQHLIHPVKSLLDTPCVMVWIYSPLQAQSIRQQLNNYHNFITTEFPSMLTKGLSIEFLSDFLKLDDKNQQTLFVIIDTLIWRSELSDILIEIDSLPRKNVVVWCQYTVFCRHLIQQSNNLIPRHRFVFS